MAPRSIRVFLWLNGIFLVGHLILERARHDLNWMRLGERSALSKAYIGLESSVAMLLVLIVFDSFYPDMPKLAKSKWTALSAGLIAVEVSVWIWFR